MTRSRGGDRTRIGSRIGSTLGSIAQNMPRLLRLVWAASPRWLVLSLGVTLVDSLLPAVQLYVTKLIFDRVVSHISSATASLPTGGDWTPLVSLVGLAFGLRLVQDALQQANSYTNQVLSDRFALYANGVLLQQAIRLDLAHYESPEFYDILNRAQQSGSNYPLRVLNTLTNLIGQCIGFIGLLTLLLRFSPIVMLLLFVSAIPSFWVGVEYSGRRFWMLRHQTQSKRLADYFGDVLTEQEYAKEVRLFNLGDHLVKQYMDIRDRFNEESRTLAGKQVRAKLGIGILASSGFYGAYSMVLYQAVRGAITIGDLTMYAGAFQQAQGALQGILANIALIYEYNLYVSQYFEFLGLQPQVVDRLSPHAFPVPIQTGLVIADVSFTYPGASEPTLKNINLFVQPHECIALVGANGSGKTTLLKLLARFYDVEHGQIAIDSIPLPEFALEELRANVGVLFQDFARYALTVTDNVGFGNLREHDNEERIQQAVTDAGATEVVKDLEHGYATTLGKIFAGGAELSGGQWQKIGLARAFMTPAQILILDEPTSAVDAIAEHDLFQRFRQLTKGKITFLVSHRFSTVRMADRIVVLEKGEIVEVGSHAELLAKKGLYERMFRLQAASYQEERS
jgi:ATP-binding cassette, subfamily B, bacterial